MWSSDSEHELAVTAAAGVHLSPSSPSTVSPPPALQSSRRCCCRHRRRRRRKSGAAASATSPREDKPEQEGPEAEDVWRGAQWEAAWPGRHQARPVVVLAAEDGGDQVGRSRSLTDDDLEELKGCADLGFGFSYDEIPELRGTLPALELCYSMSQRLLDDHHPPQPPADAAPEADAAAAAAPPVTNWKISSPGDSPDEVKARIKYWAQAVACTVRLCS